MKTEELIKMLEDNPLANFYRKEEHVAQWCWCKDWKDEWAKAYYVGPREEWMNPMEEK
tara:strand:- start:599 stop:772 length:174 start_codon:yes stop_codon:yes gene_type:complete